MHYIDLTSEDISIGLSWRIYQHLKVLASFFCCWGEYCSSNLHKFSRGGQFSIVQPQLNKDLTCPIKIILVWSVGSFIARKTNELAKKILHDENKLFQLDYIQHCFIEAAACICTSQSWLWAKTVDRKRSFLVCFFAFDLKIYRYYLLQAE